MDKLFRISSTSKIDSVINSANNSGEALDELTNTKAAAPAAKAVKTGGGEMKRRKTDISEVSADGDQPLYKSINNNSASVVTTPVRNDHNDRSPSSDTHNEISKVFWIWIKIFKFPAKQKKMQNCFLGLLFVRNF